MNVCQNLIVGSQLFPNERAIVFGEQVLTYAELERLSGCAAHVLSELGVQPGERLGIVIGNVPAFPVWYYACLRLGAIAVSVNTRLTGVEMAFILSDCEAKVVVGTDDLLANLGAHTPSCVEHQLAVAEDGMHFDEQALTASGSIGQGVFSRLEPDAAATILYTSGTTGFPKGATLSHQNVRATVHAFNHLCEMKPSDRLLLAVPLFHCYGQNALLNAGLNVGATIVMQRRFDLNESKQLIREHRVTKLFGVPTTFQLMLDSCTPDDLSSIEYCFSAAATLPPQVGQRWQATFGMPIYEGYGLTETAPFASYNHHLKFVAGSIGTPVDLVEMKIIDPDTDQECPVGVPGEIAIRGPNVMLGYWNRPEDTKQAIRNGWFLSGDIGTMDNHGYFYIVDRLKDMIAVGGLKVFPAEVERVLLDHPVVADAAVVGHDDHVWGEKVVAFIVKQANTELSQEDIRHHCQQQLAAYKVPSKILVAGDLPRNPAGKVLKNELRSQLDELLGTESSSDSVKPADQDKDSSKPRVTYSLMNRFAETYPAGRLRMLAAYVQEEVRLLTGAAEDLPENALLMDAGMDSMVMIELRDRLQAQVASRVELSPTLVFDYPRIADLANFLLTALEEQHQEASAPVKTSPSNPSGGQLNESTMSIDQMSEQEALKALLREIDE